MVVQVTAEGSGWPSGNTLAPSCPWSELIHSTASLVKKKNSLFQRPRSNLHCSFHNPVSVAEGSGTTMISDKAPATGDARVLPLWGPPGGWSGVKHYGRRCTLPSRIKIKGSSCLRILNFIFKTKTSMSSRLYTEIRLITGHRAKLQFALAQGV